MDGSPSWVYGSRVQRTGAPAGTGTCTQIVASLHRCADDGSVHQAQGHLTPLQTFWFTAATFGSRSASRFSQIRIERARQLTSSPAPGDLPLCQGVFLRGLRLKGTDVDRGWGERAEISGPVGALIMVASGRTAPSRHPGWTLSADATRSHECEALTDNGGFLNLRKSTGS